MIAFFLTSTLGRLLAGACVASLLLLGAYFKGRWDGREACNERALQAELAVARADLEAANKATVSAQAHARTIEGDALLNAERVRALEDELAKEAAAPPPAAPEPRTLVGAEPPAVGKPASRPATGCSLSPRDVERLRAIR